MTLEQKFNKVEGDNVVIMSAPGGFKVGYIAVHHFLNIGQEQPTIEEAIDDALERQAKDKAKAKRRKKRRK